MEFAGPLAMVLIGVSLASAMANMLPSLLEMSMGRSLRPIACKPC